jgi:hypothetical protein
MRTAGPSGFFQWPRKKDECWVPLEHILNILPVPSTTSSGRHYQFDEDTLTETNKLFDNFVKSHLNA